MARRRSPVRRQTIARSAARRRCAKGRVNLPAGRSRSPASRRRPRPHRGAPPAPQCGQPEARCIVRRWPGGPRSPCAARCGRQARRPPAGTLRRTSTGRCRQPPCLPTGRRPSGPAHGRAGKRRTPRGDGAGHPPPPPALRRSAGRTAAPRDQVMSPTITSSDQLAATSTPAMRPGGRRGSCQLPRAASSRSRRSARAMAAGRAPPHRGSRDRGDAVPHQELGELGAVGGRLPAQR